MKGVSEIRSHHFFFVQNQSRNHHCSVRTNCAFNMTHGLLVRFVREGEPRIQQYLDYRAGKIESQSREICDSSVYT